MTPSRGDKLFQVMRSSVSACLMVSVKNRLAAPFPRAGSSTC